MKLKRFTAGLVSFLILFSFGVMVANAQAPRTTGQTVGGTVAPPGQTVGGTVDTAYSPKLKFTLDNPLKNDADNLPDLLNLILTSVILPIGEILIVLAFIYTGFQFVTAQGNPTKLGDAKKSLINTAIGTAVLLGAWGISLVIHNTVNDLITK